MLRHSTVGRTLQNTSMAESGGNRPGNFNETETIVGVVVLFIRIRTTILVVCVCVYCERKMDRVSEGECERGSGRERDGNDEKVRI